MTNNIDFSSKEFSYIFNDLSEMNSLLAINKYSKESNGDISKCLSRLSELSDDTKLNIRGKYIRETNLLDHNDLINNLKFHSSNYCTTIPNCENCSINKYCNHYINNQIKSVDTSAPKFVDLFCGAGGLSLGFKQEGFVLSLANDIEPCCIDTYTHNHPETPSKHIILGDINSVIDNLSENLLFKQVDMVIGGPPCQGFSMANRQRLIDDPRNNLYKSYIKVVDLLQPKFIVMENVKGMLSVVDQVKEDFKSIGFEVSANILNAKDYGVPQNRERLIFIGNRLGIDNDKIFEELYKLKEQIPNYTLKDALYGLKPLSALRIKNATELYTDESGRKIDVNTCEIPNEYINMINNNKHIPFILNHKARYNNDRDIEIYSRLYQGDKSDDPKIADIMPYSNRNHIFKDKYFKLENNKVCKTITAHMKFDCNMYIHPFQARGLTPREAARVQSYPDDYFFRGAYTKTYMQIGNAVPPLLGRSIAKILKKYL